MPSSSLPPSSSPPPSSSFQDPADPFGFFALEKKLKLRRACDASTRPPLASIAHHNPPVPRTPRKQQLKRGPPLLPQSPDPDRSPSSPCTPSPSKPPLKQPNPTQQTKTDASPIPALDSSFPQRASVRKSQHRKAPKAPQSNSNAPRRMRTRQAARAPRKSHDLDEDGGQKETPGPSKGRLKTAVGVARKKRGQKDEARPAKKDGVDDNQLKKWEEERRARLEYFKRLETYEVAKENVYVI